MLPNYLFTVCLPPRLWALPYLTFYFSSFQPLHWQLPGAKQRTRHNYAYTIDRLNYPNYPDGLVLLSLFQGKGLQGLPQVTHLLSGKASKMTQVQERHLKASHPLWVESQEKPNLKSQGIDQLSRAGITILWIYQRTRLLPLTLKFLQCGSLF